LRKTFEIAGDLIDGSRSFLLLIEDAIERIGAQVIKILPRERKSVYCPTHVLRCQPGTPILFEGTIVSILPDFHYMRAVFGPIRFLLSTLLAN
jgi:hypothetical protein